MDYRIPKRCLFYFLAERLRVSPSGWLCQLVRWTGNSHYRHAGRHFQLAARHTPELILGQIIMLDQWSNFFVMVGSGAAALAGLVFVAMSINPGTIIRNSTHKSRAINMLTGFTAVFMACSFALIGNQSLEALGWEWFALWLIATAIFVRGYVNALRAGMSSIGLTLPRLAGGTFTCYLAEVMGAILLIIGRSAGLYLAAAATIVLFGFLISGAWLLIVGIHEDQARR